MFIERRSEYRRRQPSNFSKLAHTDALSPPTNEDEPADPETQSCGPKDEPPLADAVELITPLGKREKQAVSRDASPISSTASAASNNEVRELKESLKEHKEVVSDIKDAVLLLTELRESDKCEAKRGRNGCDSCICRATKRARQDAPTNETLKLKEKKRRADSDADPTYQPPINTDFSYDHMPLHTTRSKNQAKSIVLVDLTGEGSQLGPSMAQAAWSVPRTPPEGLRHYDHLAPVGENGLVDCMELISMKTRSIPKAMQLAFQPPGNLQMSGVKLVVATYLFSKELSKSEVLADTGDMTLARRSLFSLVPKAKIHGEVLNTVVTMLSNESPNYNWFIPTPVMQAALEGPQLSRGSLARIHEIHMASKVDKAKRIYVPMWCPGHWIYLDSDKIEGQVAAPKVSMERVALYLDSITLGENWLSSPNAERPRFSGFKFQMAEVPRQQRGS
ncbi:hypothetical protein PIB30_059597 [Stylosanthes scabra]|uniref:Uncharacterized protein n=1 Tax=Stylosanthes scabra TaxID=79078 RepID=A0ABU6WIS6_9FABA|nr:hypothetical protein [Stylosanthes scabra]